MKFRVKVGPKGQAVIPKEVREILRIRPGDEVVFELKEDGALVKPAGHGSSVMELAGLIPKEAKLRKDIDIKKIILSEAVDQWSTGSDNSSGY